MHDLYQSLYLWRNLPSIVVENCCPSSRHLGGPSCRCNLMFGGRNLRKTFSLICIRKNKSITFSKGYILALIWGQINCSESKGDMFSLYISCFAVTVHVSAVTLYTYLLGFKNFSFPPVNLGKGAGGGRGWKPCLGFEYWLGQMVATFQAMDQSRTWATEKGVHSRGVKGTPFGGGGCMQRRLWWRQGQWGKSVMCSLGRGKRWPHVLVHHTPHPCLSFAPELFPLAQSCCLLPDWARLLPLTALEPEPLQAASGWWGNGQVSAPPPPQMLHSLPQQ